jgi:predicted nucleotidyltransferase
MSITNFVYQLQKETTHILNGNVIGFYLHGSLAMGGFNQAKSDIDVLVVTKHALTSNTRKRLAMFLLTHSNSPYPIEISFLHEDQLLNWQHPCPFDFHYSEYWRKHYEEKVLNDSSAFNHEMLTDPDLAAHITIINHRGICLEGREISDVFPVIPPSDYISSIIGDYVECLENIVQDPVYCILNMIRVYRYLLEDVISSKEEAGEWGLNTLPQKETILKVVKCYQNISKTHDFSNDELYAIRDYLARRLRLIKDDR